MNHREVRWRAFLRRRDVLLATLPFYVALYVVWPFDQGTRYLAPMLPVFVVSLWELLGTGWSRRWRRPIVAFLLVAHLGVAVAGLWRDARLARFDDEWPRVEAIAEVLPPGQRDRVATAGLGLERTLMLQLALDRPVHQLRPGDDPGDALWLLTPAGARPAGFHDAPGAFGDWWLHARK